jgi:hypothetical protein
MTRIWMEVIPERELSWPRTGTPPPGLVASRPAGYVPGRAIELSDAVRGWVSRYPRPPVLSFVDATGRPAATRVGATMHRDRIVLDGTVESIEGAPVSLAYHQLTGNYSVGLLRYPTRLPRGVRPREARHLSKESVGYSVFATSGFGPTCQETDDDDEARNSRQPPRSPDHGRTDRFPQTVA